jgi:hypothetical protein
MLLGHESLNTSASSTRLHVRILLDILPNVVMARISRVDSDWLYFISEGILVVDDSCIKNMIEGKVMKHISNVIIPNALTNLK